MTPIQILRVIRTMINCLVESGIVETCPTTIRACVRKIHAALIDASINEN